jgi:predicted ester cyclase
MPNKTTIILKLIFNTPTNTLIMRTFKNSIIVLICLSTLLVFSCQDKQAKEDLINYQKSNAIVAKNIELIKELYKLLDEQKLKECNSRFASEAKGFMGSSEESFVFEDIIPFIKMYYSAFPDYKHHIENIFAADDYVVVQLKYTGTHKNEFMEIKPTGNSINYKGIFIFKLKDGEIIESWGMEDDLTLMKQLGLDL